MGKKRKKTRRASRIPDFATREEEAKFWDTHDISDYWDEMKPVKARFAKKLSAKQQSAAKNQP